MANIHCIQAWEESSYNPLFRFYHQRKSFQFLAVQLENQTMGQRRLSAGLL